MSFGKHGSANLVVSRNKYGQTISNTAASAVTPALPLLHLTLGENQIEVRQSQRETISRLLY